MTYLVCAFILGCLIPFITRRLGKILPATTGLILFNLPHFPRFPKVHNPLQHAEFRKKWLQLLGYSLFLGCVTTILFILAKTYLPASIFLYVASFIWIILCAADADIRYLILPDCLTIPLLLLGFLFASQTGVITPIQSVYGSLFAYLITLLAVFVLGFRKQTLFGAGDSKMAIALGSWLGVQGLNYTIFVSFFLFIIYSFLIKKRAGAYGPALGIAALLCFFILYSK